MHLKKRIPKTFVSPQSQKLKRDSLLPTKKTMQRTNSTSKFNFSSKIFKKFVNHMEYSGEGFMNSIKNNFTKHTLEKVTTHC